MLLHVGERRGHGRQRETNVVKRTPLKRSTKQLTRTPLNASRQPIPRQSAKRKAVAPERRKFVAEFLADNPVCEISWDNCTVRSIDVHEALPRSAGGAIVPGEQADMQGQRFVSVCRMCHGQLTNPTALERLAAIEAGWLISRYG